MCVCVCLNTRTFNWPDVLVRAVGNIGGLDV